MDMTKLNKSLGAFVTTARIILVDHAYNSEQQTIDVFDVLEGSDPETILFDWMANQPEDDLVGNEYRCELE
jgi:hypothetical protein